MATATQIKNFISKLGALAVAECNRRISENKGFVLPSVCIAQSALETGWGTAGIMVKANAYFGIKAGGSWTGAVYRADTWEVDSGGAYNTTANFRAYPSLSASVTDYYDLIGNNSRYANGLSFGLNSATWKTPKECITAIWAGGYATDTLYVEKIMNTITARDLTYYDKLIDGVSNLPVYTFDKRDMVQGGLKVIDSGRSVENDRTVTTAVSIEWDEAPTVKSDITYPLIFDDVNYNVELVKLNGDTVNAVGIITSGVDVILSANTKFGFSIKKKDGTAISPGDLPDTFTVSFGYDSDLPEFAEQYGSVIAHFVKVE